MQLLPGLIVVAAVAAAAWLVGATLPLFGGPVIAVLLGIALHPQVSDPRYRPGLALAARLLLQVAVVLLGLLLSTTEVARVGLAAMPVLAASLVMAMVAAVLLARLLRLPRILAILITVGTMICGASAIAAVSSVLEPEEDDIAYAISTIFAFNILAVLTFPVIGHLTSLSDRGFGLWAGTAINDTSSAVAAATVYSSAAVGFAVVVKLARALMIVPVTLALSMWQRRESSSAADQQIRLRSIVPTFMLGFVIAVLVQSAGLVPQSMEDPIRLVAALLTTAALAAIGLSTNPTALRATGPRPFLFGGALWITVAATSLGAQALLGLA